ncbi:redoxin domain-containing protein [Novosphingobium sp. FSY-8]|uniref:thioredoxin-dependent peroxiredoxin n=2 Tax=Novosphingobium ovatum TaxID=1908523 RepID=A0ABW9XC22_9SPHN|nr:redoxin domain-containing protein [Novosphingobium ovatum]
MAAAAAVAVAATPAHAELAVGSRAPQFATQGALGGKTIDFNLQKALKKGPVVVYFYPKAFTQGCTLEAHAFAEAMPDFAKAGASVIGLSVDDLPTLQRFSTEECRDAFPVGIATPTIVKGFDVELTIPGRPAALTKRTSYVIGRDGKVKLAFTDMDFKDHVAKTLATVRGLKQGR